MSSISTLAMFNNVSCNKAYCSFGDLAIGDYLVTNFTLVKTKYETRVRVDLGEQYLLHPVRYAEGMTYERIAQMNEKPKWMCYYGKDPKKNNKILLDFRTITEFAVSALGQPNNIFISNNQ